MRSTTSSRSAAGTVRAALAQVAKALGHEHRVELVEQLAQGPRSVEALAERVGLSLANASQHLQQLRRVGLVSTQRDGKRVVYRLADEAESDIVSLLGALRHVAEQSVASMERIVGRGMSWNRSPPRSCWRDCARAMSCSSTCARKMNTGLVTCRAP
jgi:DNA-binding transcriptional ArsR family regulator